MIETQLIKLNTSTANFSVKKGLVRLIIIAKLSSREGVYRIRHL